MKNPGFKSLLPLLAALSLAAAPAADDDIPKQLAKEKEAYAASAEKAKAELIKDIDKYSRTVKSATTLKADAQLALLDKIDAEKKLFEVTGVPPLTSGLKIQVAEYRASQKKAENQYKAALDKATKFYRDKNDLKAVADTLDELKEFLANAPSATGIPYYIGSKFSGKVFGFRDLGGEGSKVVTAIFAPGNVAQQWRTIPAKDGWVYLENVATGLVLAADGRAEGTEAIIAKKKDSDQQLWKITPVDGHKDTVRYVNKASAKVLTVTGRNRDAGTRITLWADEKDSSQWYLTTPAK